ncbi:hypothetical protein, partial [Thiolapillus sp.]|uniref:hypothetical protein n=1 Tax=Thiolapillus sp. TaxID=2017437 RepID=UPI0027392356
ATSAAPTSRCQPWRAKRRLVVPSSREAALFSRRALRQRENKQACLRPRDRFWGRVDGRISPDALSLCRPGR